MNEITGKFSRCMMGQDFSVQFVGKFTNERGILTAICFSTQAKDKTMKTIFIATPELQ